jgi:hypothetical protein
LAGAIGTATGTTAPVQKSATSVEDLLMPKSGEPKPPRSADGAKQPDSLDSALDQLAGKPGDQPAAPGRQAVAGPGAQVPLDPKKVEQFKALARQAMTSDGVPPDQIEQRLNAMVAAAQKPLPAYTPPKPDKMPPPGFGDGFADRWFDTEQGIKNLLGQGGPGAPGVLESWRDLIKSTNDQITNPVGTAIDEVKSAVNSPSAAYYLGEKAADGAVAAPGLIFGGEGALAARAGALDDLASVGAIPHELIDNPTPTGGFEHHTPTPLGDLPSHHGTPSPVFDSPPPATAARALFVRRLRSNTPRAGIHQPRRRADLSRRQLAHQAVRGARHRGPRGPVTRRHRARALRLPRWHIPCPGRNPLRRAITATRQRFKALLPVCRG